MYKFIKYLLSAWTIGGTELDMMGELRENSHQTLLPKKLH